jgi:hypothetical protein
MGVASRNAASRGRSVVSGGRALSHICEGAWLERDDARDLPAGSVAVRRSAMMFGTT